MNHTEVEDQDWLVEWSLSQKYAQMSRGGHYFGPMFMEKPATVSCEDGGEHDRFTCMDSPGDSERVEAFSLSPLVVEVYDEDGQFVDYEWLNVE